MSGPMKIRTGLLLLALSLGPGVRHLWAQTSQVKLSSTEEDEVRESGDDPRARVALFQRLINDRVERLKQVLADTRAQGRMDDMHDLIQDVAGLSDELGDNLSEYSQAHSDVRKALPKLVAATDRWVSTLHNLPEEDAYSVPRKLALESLADLKSDAADLEAEQQAWFKEHRPAKNSDAEGPVQFPEPHR